MNCANCHYFKEHDEDEDAAFCKRYPPVYTPDENGEMVVTYPVVSSSDWCGEFRPPLNS